MDLNEFSLIFKKKGAAFSLQTSDNNLKPPLNQFKRQIEVQQLTTTRGRYMYMYVHKPNVKYMGASWKKKKKNPSKYRWFQTKQFTRLLEFTKLYKENPLEKENNVHYLSKLCIGFKAQYDSFSFLCTSSVVWKAIRMHCHTSYGMSHIFLQERSDVSSCFIMKKNVL